MQFRQLFFTLHLLLNYLPVLFARNIHSSHKEVRAALSCWSKSNGSWIPDKNPFYVNYSDPYNVWKNQPFKCPPETQPYEWKPHEGCSHEFTHFSVKSFCRNMRGRPLVMMGDSLMYYSYLTFINAMANGRPYVLDKDGNSPHFTRLHPIEFRNYPPRTEFLYFDKACEEVNEKPFVLFMNNNPYLDIAPTTLEWLSNNSNAILFINRGYHYQATSPSYENLFKSILIEYLKRIHHEPLPPSSSSSSSSSSYDNLTTFSPPTTQPPQPQQSSQSSKNGYIIFRSIHMAHPSCHKYLNSYPFTSLNYSLYYTPSIVQQLQSSYNWLRIIQQDQDLTQPVIHQIIQNNLYFSQLKLFYLDIFSSSKLMIRRHTGDCLHYCVPGPMNSWIVFLLNTIQLLNKVDDKLQ